MFEADFIYLFHNRQTRENEHNKSDALNTQPTIWIPVNFYQDYSKTDPQMNKMSRISRPVRTEVRVCVCGGWSAAVAELR